MKQINVSVVGMSGTERDKGQIGVGKSCFCNRFVRPQTDDYFIDHISVLSQSDFSGRIVNNDHFLYWGDVRKTSDEGVDYQFHVVEQTEFVDDATFQPFKVGKMEPYIKRATALKVLSAEKLMYICKSQLGIEREYEQRVIPDGRLAIDGFICLFDVSPVPNRSVEKQVEYVHQLIATILKNKKPVLLVTTKNDEANELFVREAEKICQRKEYKGTLYMVETSAHDAINVDMAFILLAQLIDKAKTRTKITTYAEASRSRKELLDISSEQVTRLIRQQITDYHTTWSQALKLLAHNKDWVDFLDLFSAETGQRIFRRHIKKLREENVARRLHLYMDNFGAVLPDLVPHLNTVNLEIEGGDWNAVRAFIKNHVDYEQFFFECDQAPWTDLSDVSECEDEARIPFDVLSTADAETVFRNHVNALQQEQKRLEMPKRWKKQFKKLLEEAGFVTPGKQLSEVRVLFMGRECFEALSEHDCQQIYDNHQKEIVDRAKHNFLELLLEHADLFYHFKSIEPSGTITQEDVKDITNVLQDDVRYKMLDRLDQDRKLMLFQHLGFVHCPIREHCPAFPNCIDGVIERIIGARRTHSMRKGSGGVGGGAAATATGVRPARPRWQAPPPPTSGADNVLNLLILGSEHLASDVVNEICLNCGDDGEYIYDGQAYYLNTRIVNGDLDSFKSLDLAGSGLVCVYSNQQSSEFLRDSLERSLLLELEDRFDSLPLVLVYQPEDQKDDQENELQRTEGQHLADMLHCLFIDTSLNFYHHRQSQHQNYIYDILNHLIECVRLKQQQHQHQQQLQMQQPDDAHHSGALDEDGDDDDEVDELDDVDDVDDMDDVDDEYHRSRRRRRRRRRHHHVDAQPDIRIILCMFCGDPFSVESVLQPILAEPTCQLTGDRSVMFETFLGDTKRRIEVIMSSYHGANAFRDELVHGFILLYATKRRASLATLNAFSMNIPNLPMQLLAITDNGGPTAFFNNDLCQMLITEGNAVADKLRAHFMTSSINNQLKFAFYTPFLKEVWDKKPEIEQAFHMEEPVTLDSGEGTLEHSMHHLPQPPPRHESYMLKHNTAGTDGSGSENYEHLPTRSLNSLNGEKDMGIDDTYLNDDDKDDKARLIHQGFQIYPPPTTPPEPAPPDHHHMASAPMMRVSGPYKSADRGGAGGGGGGGGIASGSAHPHAHMVSASQSSLDDITSDVSGSKDSLTTHDSGWIDDGVFMQKDGSSSGGRGRNLVWNNFGGNTPHHAFTTGRPHPQRSGGGGLGADSSSSGMGGFANKIRPKGPSQTLKLINPGKLNLKNFAIVNEAIARMTITDGQSQQQQQQQQHGAQPQQLEGDASRRRRPPPQPSPRHHHHTMAGAAAAAAVASVGRRTAQTRSKSNGSLFFAPHYAPLAAADPDGDSDDDDDDLAEYAQVKEVYAPSADGCSTSGPQPPDASGGSGLMMYAFPHDGHMGATTPNKHQQGAPQPPGKMTRHRRDVNKKYSDSDSESSSSERQNAHGYYKMNRANKPPATHKRMRKKRTAIPVQPPKVPQLFGVAGGGSSVGGTYVSPPEIPMQMYQKMKTASSATALGDKQRLVAAGGGSVDKMLGKSMYTDVHEEESSIDISSPRDNNSPLFGVVPKALKGESDREKLIGDRKREKAEEKLDKRRAKEDAKMRKLIDKEREAEKKAKRKSKQTAGSKAGDVGAGGACISDFVQSEKNFIPLFLERCVEFIEQEGLDSEGIYRVPGNRAHVDLLYQKLQEDANIDIDALDIPVNAVATGLKDFFSKHLPPLFDKDLMTELEDIAACITSRSGAPTSTLSMEVKTDRSCRLLALRSLLDKLPAINFSILKYIFAHFVRVSENAKLNSMDSKNLAICWWPTLIPIEFTDMGHFEQLRPYLEDIVQTMIDQYPFLFCGKEAFVMV